jgi:hypothetical protein
MKNLRRLLVLIVVTVAVAGAGLVEWFNILAARHREQVRQELQKILGQDATFASLEVNLLGRPGFVAKDLRVADDSRFAATPLLRADEFVLGVSVWDLLFRRLVITSLTFNDPELQVITDESGQLNLAALVSRKAELRKFPRLQRPASERRPLPVSFAVDEIRIEGGRIDYLDRSVKEPAELRLGNISLSVQGLAPTETLTIHIAAALTEGLGQDLRIDGRLTPPPENSSWVQRGVDMTLRFDSLRVPVVARAIAAVRDKIPDDLDVTGPMAFQAKAGGTLEQPAFDDITLKIPLFGSSDYNAVLTGSVHFTEQRTWEDAQLRGRLAIEPLALARLQKLKFLAQNLPPALVADGTVNVYSRFEGTWETLRVGTLVRADKAALDYGAWFHKAPDSPATIRAQLSRTKQRLVFHESELVLGANKLGFSGDGDISPAPRLRLKLRSENASVAAWSEYLAPYPLVGASGNFDLDVTFVKQLAPGDGDWNMAGQLKLADAGLKHGVGGRNLDNLHAEVAFVGKGARLQATRFRLGRANFILDGSVANLLVPRLAYSLRSPEVELGDLPLIIANPPVRLKRLNGVGEIYLDNDRWRLNGSIASPEGELNSFPYRDLRADIDLSASGLGFKNVWAQTLNGLFRAEGVWSAATDRPQQLQFTAQLDGVELPALIGHLLPPLKDRFGGQLNGHGRFRVTSADDAEAKNSLEGSFETAIQSGVIRDFNLVSQLLLRGSGTAVSAASMSRLPPSFAGLVNRSDTPFESLKATLTIDQKRIFTDDLVIATPDYTVTGAGWIGFDRLTNWNGSIVLSPRLTQEVQRDYRMIRYLLDRRGRLPIAFRVEGKIPRVAVRLENRALAQALRGGAASSSGPDGASAGTANEDKHWLPDALERFLNR